MGEGSCSVAIEGVLERVRNVLEPRARFAIVFGSILSPERFGLESDLDVAAHFGRPLADGERSRLEGDLVKATGREVDLIVLDTADLIISMQAHGTGRVLFSDPPGAVGVHKAQVLGQYVDFKRSRADIERHLVDGIPHARK